ncbi:MAG: hypothetical protein JNN00_00875, partial [Chitinophagaceae bacterium]|nr:hypothetical protein [Chitinophagaceae bacterium]
SWYNNRSGNQLIDYPLPYTSGPFGHYVVNLPALLSNRGFEFELAIAPVRTKKMTWTITGNASLTRNKLLKYPGLESSSFANTYVIGEDISIVKAYSFTGVNVQTGLPEYEDVNRDGRISAPDDYVIIGKTSPSSYGGVGTDIQYYGFQFSVFFQFSNQYAQGLSTIPGTRSNKFRIALQRWQKPGDITPIPRATITATTPYLNLARSDAAFYDASYWRLKNVSLSYKLSEKIAHKMRMSSCRIYCEGQNLLTWHKEGNLYDPETANGGIAPLMTVVFGIQLTF